MAKKITVEMSSRRGTVRQQRASKITSSTTSSSSTSSSSSSSSQSSSAKSKSSGRFLVPDLIAKIAIPLFHIGACTIWLLGSILVLPGVYSDPAVVFFHRCVGVFMYTEVVVNWLFLRYVDSSYFRLLKKRWTDKSQEGERTKKRWVTRAGSGSPAFTDNSRITKIRSGLGLPRFTDAASWITKTLGLGSRTFPDKCCSGNNEVPVLPCPDDENSEKLSCGETEEKSSSCFKADQNDTTQLPQNENDDKSFCPRPGESQLEVHNSDCHVKTSATEGMERKRDMEKNEEGLRKRYPWKQDCENEERSQKHETEKGQDGTAGQTTQDQEKEAGSPSVSPKREETRAEDRSRNAESWKPEFKPPPQMIYPYWSWSPCYVCRVVRPPRCHHCALCNTCVLKRDHHCFFSGSCVGWRNQRYFVMMATWGFVGCAYATAHFFPYILWHLWPLMSWYDLLAPVAIVRAVLGYTSPSVCVYVCVQTLLAYFVLLAFDFIMEHFSNVASGLTTFEVNNLKKNVEIRDSRELGDKFRAVLGRNWALTFLCPLHWLFEAEEDPENWPSVTVYRH